MLCIFVYARPLLDFVRSQFPSTYQHIVQSFWLEIMTNFMVGCIGSVFLSTIIIVFFHLTGVDNEEQQMPFGMLNQIWISITFGEGI